METKMSQCDLHFGDPTAHATVEWFLRDLTEEKITPFRRTL